MFTLKVCTILNVSERTDIHNAIFPVLVAIFIVKKKNSTQSPNIKKDGKEALSLNISFYCYVRA
jgi:hypothetical protein